MDTEPTAQTAPHRFASGTALAARFRELADKVEPVGDLATTCLFVNFQVTDYSLGDDLQRVAAVDALAAAFGVTPTSGSPDDAGRYRFGAELDTSFIQASTSLQSGVEERRAKLLAELAKLPPAEPARPTQDDPFADYGFNPTTPADHSLDHYTLHPVASYTCKSGCVSGSEAEHDEHYAAAVRGELPATPAAPVAVSPERVAEILTLLNGKDMQDPFHYVIKDLPELVDGSQRWDGGYIWGFGLVDGTTFRRPFDQDFAAGWSVTR